MIKIRGAIQLDQIKKMGTEKEEKDRKEKQRKSLSRTGEYYFKIMIHSMCAEQACTFEMIKKCIKTVIRKKEYDIPEEIKIYIEDVGVMNAIKEVILSDGYGSGSDVDHVKGNWEIIKKGFKRYYLHQYNIVCPFFIPNEDLPLYINTVWDSNYLKDYYIKRVKNYNGH